jgi:hypothetical protein
MDLADVLQNPPNLDSLGALPRWAVLSGLAPRHGDFDVRNNAVWQKLAKMEVAMPRYFFDVKDGHRLFDATGFSCDDDADAIIKATVLAIGVSLDKPEDDPERRIAILNDAGREIGTVPVYSRPSYKNPAQ